MQYIFSFYFNCFYLFLYFQNKIHISYYRDFIVDWYKKIISPCMLKNTNFAFFILCFYACTNKTPPIQFTLMWWIWGYQITCFFLLHDTMWFDSKRLWLYNIVIQKYLIFYFFFSGTWKWPSHGFIDATSQRPHLYPKLLCSRPTLSSHFSPRKLWCGGGQPGSFWTASQWSISFEDNPFIGK